MLRSTCNNPHTTSTNTLALNPNPHRHPHKHSNNNESHARRTDDGPARRPAPLPPAAAGHGRRRLGRHGVPHPLAPRPLLRQRAGFDQSAGASSSSLVVCTWFGCLGPADPPPKSLFNPSPNNHKQQAAAGADGASTTTPLSLQHQLQSMYPRVPLPPEFLSGVQPSDSGSTNIGAAADTERALVRARMFASLAPRALLARGLDIISEDFVYFSPSASLCVFVFS